MRTFINENLTAELKNAGELPAGVYADQPVALEWHKILTAKGWAVPTKDIVDVALSANSALARVSISALFCCNSIARNIMPSSTPTLAKTPII